MDKLFYPTLYTGCNYLSTMGPKLIHISERGNWWSNHLDITLVVLTINCLSKTFPDFVIKVLCFLTKINLTFKFQLMVHEKLSWMNCKCPVDHWQPGQIVLKKFHPSKNPEHIDGLVHDWSNFSTLAIKLMHSCSEPPIFYNLSFIISWMHDDWFSCYWFWFYWMNEIVIRHRLW